MPQLDPLSYMTQLVGWMSVLTLFYTLVVRTILPPLKTLQSVRERWTEVKEQRTMQEPELKPISLETPAPVLPSTPLASIYMNHLVQQLAKNETLRTI